MSLIVKVIQRYYEDWEPPKPGRGKWVSCLCPFHGDTNKSASISFVYDAFNCFVCDMRGDAIKIIRQREEVSYSEAKRIAEGLSEGGNGQIPDSSPRQSRRKVFGEPRSGGSDQPRSTGRDRQVHAGIRRRTATRS